MDRFLQTRRELMERALAGYLPSANGVANPVSAAIRYLALAPGKRFRPILLLEIAEALGVAPEKVLPSACAIEFIHTSSLILDDLPCMDDARIRRGQPAVHIAFNEYSAILAAIALLMEAFSLISRNAEALELPRTEALKMVGDLAETIGLKGMIAGQYLDLALEDVPLDEDKVKYISDHKTTVLFESTVRIACALCGAPEETREHLMDYGKKIGQAFQIADDILDVKPNPDAPAKDTHQDAHKTTCVKLFGIEGAKERVNGLVREAIEALDRCHDLHSNHLQRLAEYISEQVV